MKHETIISRIVSAIKGNKVAVRENLFYNTNKGLIDFQPDDLPNLRAVLAAITGSGISVPITAGVTGTPKSVPYTSTGTPSYTLVRSSDNSFDFNTSVIYDGVNFTINGADDGSGKFADSYTFNIKP